MSHELLGEMFYGHENPGWHALGKVSDEIMTPLEALEWTGQDFEIEKHPLLVDLGGVLTTFGKYAIVRSPVAADPTYRVIGEAGENYAVLQNRDVCRLVTPLTEVWPLETMGSIEQGQTFFLTLKAGAFDVKGEEIQNYFGVLDCRDGASALDVLMTPVRMVCKNTCVMGKAAAIATGAIRHMGDVEAEFEWRVKLLQSMQKVQDQTRESFLALADAALTDVQAAEIIAKAYPLPRRPRRLEWAANLSDEERANLGGLLENVASAQRIYEVDCARIVERRTLADELFQTFNGSFPQTSGTAWAAYNAVVEAEDYRAPAGKETQEAAILSALVGDRAAAKARAYAAALEYAIVR